MLSKEKILEYISRTTLLKKKDTPVNDVFSQVQSSSVDLTIDRIYSGDEEIANYSLDVRESGLDIMFLQPGQTVVIQVAEEFLMPEGLGGIVFPPNSMSKSGVIMTNPGHIDPNFKGTISVYLVNMGKRDVKLIKGDKVATLLLFEIQGNTEIKNDLNGYGVSKDQVLSLSKDFANLNDRIPKLISKFFKDRVVKWGSLAIATIAILFVVFPIATKIYFDEFRLKTSFDQLSSKTKDNKTLIDDLKLSLDEKDKELTALRESTKIDKSQIDKLDIRLEKSEIEIKNLSKTLEKVLSKKTEVNNLRRDETEKGS